MWGPQAGSACQRLDTPSTSPRTHPTCLPLMLQHVFLPASASTAIGTNCPQHNQTLTFRWALQDAARPQPALGHAAAASGVRLVRGAPAPTPTPTPARTHVRGCAAAACRQARGQHHGLRWAVLRLLWCRRGWVLLCAGREEHAKEPPAQARAQVFLGTHSTTHNKKGVAEQLGGLCR